MTNNLFLAFSRLWKHYRSLFGIRAALLLTDRILRRAIGRTKIYQAFWRGGHCCAFTPKSHRVLADRATRDWFVRRFPRALEQKTAAAERICKHEFDFLGTGPIDWGNPISWHRDVRSGYTWPVEFYTAYTVGRAPRQGVDIKIPWELSRFHHLVTLGQAWWLTGEPRYAKEFFSQWESWSAANAFPYGINWTCSMEVAIRGINLLWAAGLIADAEQWDRSNGQALLQSVWQHGHYIERNLEIGVDRGHLTAANHYLANMCGLACFGLCCPELPDADRWRRVGLQALEQEIERQVLPDGFFYESSTSYHRLALELFLIPALLARQQGQDVSQRYWGKLEQMCEVVLFLTRPDGCVPQVGDNDDGRLLILSHYPDWPRHDHRYLLALGAALFQRGDLKAAAGECPEEVFWLLGREGETAFEKVVPDHRPVGGRSFPDSGLYVSRSKDGQDYTLVRTHSPAGTPVAHAHNDALSIELWQRGQPIFVDPGTSCYTSHLAERYRFRSTAMHNTALVNGVEMNRLFLDEPFRLVHDATVKVLEWEVREDRVRLVAERRTMIPGQRSVRHKRTIVCHFSPLAFVQIEDEIEPADQSFLFWQLLDDRTRLRMKSKEEALCQVGPFQVKVESQALKAVSLRPVDIATSFGCKVKGLTLQVTLEEAPCARVFTTVTEQSVSSEELQLGPLAFPIATNSR